MTYGLAVIFFNDYAPILGTKNPQRGYNLKKLFCLGIFAAFAAGLTIGEIHGGNRIASTMYTAGYDGAMRHVRSTIESKMPGLLPFYMADLGIRFVPRGNSIVTLKFIGYDSNQHNGDVTVVTTNPRKDITRSDVLIGAMLAQNTN